MGKIFKNLQKLSKIPEILNLFCIKVKNPKILGIFLKNFENFSKIFEFFRNFSSKILKKMQAQNKHRKNLEPQN